MATRRTLVNCLLALGVVAVSAVSAPATGAPLPIVDDCSEAAYLDRSAEEADRVLDWDYAFAGSPERCLKIRVGQTVTWVGNFAGHPLEQDQGDTPNPIASHDASGIVTFGTPGIFGFRCNYHFEMRGAIQVVPELVPVSVPWGGAGALMALAALLLTTGIATRVRSRAHSSDRVSPKHAVIARGP
jgi:plastocyanin